MNIDTAKQTIKKYDAQLQDLVKNLEAFDKCRTFLLSTLGSRVKDEILDGKLNGLDASEDNIVKIINYFIENSEKTREMFSFLKNENEVGAYKKLYKIITSINSHLKDLKLQTNNNERFKELNNLCNEALIKNDFERDSSEINRIIHDIHYGEITTKICAVNSINQEMMTVEITDLLIDELMNNVFMDVPQIQMGIHIEYLLFLTKKIKKLSETNHLLKEKIISKIDYFLEDGSDTFLLVLVCAVSLTEKEKTEIAEKIIDKESRCTEKSHIIIYEIISKLGLDKFTHKIMDYLISSGNKSNKDSSSNENKNFISILSRDGAIMYKDICETSSYYMINKFRDVILKNFE